MPDRDIQIISEDIGESPNPVITLYELGVVVFSASLKQKQNRKNAANALNQTLNKFLDAGMLSPNKNFPKGLVFNIFGRHGTEEEIVCSVDPFGFLSHLSAMSYHGLTDRILQKVFLSSPPTKEWKQHANKKMEKDVRGHAKEYFASGLPTLQRIPFDRINKKSIRCFNSMHLGAYKVVKNSPLRVATLGRTFLDMLRNPDLCGGIHHVIDVYSDTADSYLDLIIAEIDRHGKPIDKVRAGYILEDICHLHHSTIESWTQFAQRGGSRKLDASEEYRPVYSERWCLSLNVD